MKIRKNFKPNSIGIGLILILLISSIILLQDTNDNTEENQNDLFVYQFLLGDNLNKGIKIHAPILTFDILDGSSFGFEVRNYAQENIIFNNRYLSLRIFRFDPDLNIWSEIKSLVIPEDQKIVLCPIYQQGTKEYYVASVFIRNFDYNILESDKWVRMYVSGYGENTNEQYGAYIDINVNYPKSN